MNKTAPKKSVKKRQHSKLPLLRSKKLAKRSRAKAKPAESTVKKVAKKPVKKALTKPTKKAKRSRQLNVRLGLGLSLEIKLKHSKKRSKKSRRFTKKQLLRLWQRKGSAAVIIVVGFAGSVYFILSILKPQSPPPVYSASESVALMQTTAPTLDVDQSSKRPVKLSIPAVSINTSLITIGRNKDGTMELPKSFEKAGWYQYSPAPGELGPSIIAGHVDSFDGPAVFWRLSQLRPGQLVELKRADGQLVKFKVLRVKQFNQDNFPTQEVYGDIEYAGLRLITCGGTFNRATNSYSHNIVVYATLVI